MYLILDFLIERRKDEIVAKIIARLRNVNSVSGAASGPLIAGFVSDYLGWEYVFFTLMVSDVLAFCVSTLEFEYSY